MRPPNRSGYGDDARARSGPSDEFLAVDASSEERSFTVLYDRYADSLYRYFLATTGDRAAAAELLDGLIGDLPRALQRFTAGERSYPGWLFSLASRRFERAQESPFRFVQRPRRSLTRALSPGEEIDDRVEGREVDRCLAAMLTLPTIEREVLVLSAVIGLSTSEVSEAIGLPTLAVSARLSSGSASLAEGLEAATPADARAQLESVLGAMGLSGEQRDRHRRTIQAAFGDAEDQERAPGSLARQLATLGLVVVLGLAGLWGWNEAADWLAEEPVEDETASSAVSEPDEASTRQAPTPTSESEAAAVDDAVEPCPADERIALVEEFVSRFNAGAFDGVREMLRDPEDDRPQADQAVADDFDASGAVIPLATSSESQDDVVDRLRRRYDEGERWEILDAVAAENYPEWFGAVDVERYLDAFEEDAHRDLVMINELMVAPDQPYPARGQVVVDCANETIAGLRVDWSIEPPVAEPVGVVDFLYDTTYLRPGQERVWQVRATTNYRADAGTMRQWDLEWGQAVDQEGTLLQRVSVYSLSGEEVIRFQHDGERWRLEQRGWVRYGTVDDIPMPEEITQVVPWLARSSGVLHSNRAVVGPGTTESIVANGIDLSSSEDDAAGLSSAPDSEGSFTVQIADGSITGASVMETRDGAEVARPQIFFINVDRTREFDSEQYRFMYQPRYLDADTRIPRFEMPQDVEALDADVTPDDLGGPSEGFSIRWNDVPLELTVTPSAGGLNWEQVSDDYDDSWRPDAGEYRVGAFRWSDSGLNGVPSQAIWDNGRFRFEIRLPEDANPPSDTWNPNELIALADSLAAVGS